MKYLLIALLSVLSLSLYAQQNHFIYIQADNKQTFYVKLDKKILSSSAAGYIIIPKLQAGTYDLVIGFPKNEWPEQHVTCAVEQNDQGYLLKDFGEKGWGLFNLQSMALLMANNTVKVDTGQLAVKKEDAFAATLSNVVNDPALMQTDIAPRTDTVVAAPVNKSRKAKGLVPKDIKPLSKTKAPVVAVNYRSRVSKIYRRKTGEGIKLVYLDRIKGATDTINVEIPDSNVIASASLIKKKTESRPVTAKADQAKKPGRTKTHIVKADIKVADNPVDSVAALPVNNAEKTIAINRKNQGKKVKPAKKDIVKADIKVADNPVDSVAVVPVNKAEKAVAINRKNPGKKVKPAKKDIVKADIKPVDTPVDSIAAVVPEKTEKAVAVNEANTGKKIKPSKKDIAKAGNKMAEKPVDSVVVPKKKMEKAVAVAKVKAAAKNQHPDKAVAVNVKQPGKKLITAKARPVKTDTLNGAQPLVKLTEPVKTDSNAIVPVTDSSALMTKADIPKTDSVIPVPLTDTTVSAINAKKQEEINLAQAREDSVNNAKKQADIAVQTKDTVLKIPEPVVAEKKVEVIPVIEKTVTKVTTNANANPPRVRAVCKETADGDQFLGFKKKMAKGKDEADMMNMALKEFNKKCFSSKQLERLAILFTSDEAKFRFVEEGYMHVYDPESFPELQALFTDAGYISRFKAMMRQ